MRFASSGRNSSTGSSSLSLQAVEGLEPGSPADAGAGRDRQPGRHLDAELGKGLRIGCFESQKRKFRLKGPESAFALASAVGAHVFSIKIAQSGGLFAARDVAAIASAAGIGVYGGTMLEGACATAAAAHLFATLPKLEWGTELFGPLLLKNEILTEPLDYSDFTLGVPTGPGLGITFDRTSYAFSAAMALNALSAGRRFGREHRPMLPVKDGGALAVKSGGW